MKLRHVVLGSSLLLSVACSKAEAPPPATVAPIQITAPAPAEERAPVDEAALARQLSALGAGPAASVAPVAAAAPAKRKIRRPIAAAAEETTWVAPAEDNRTLSDAQFQRAIGGWRGLKACLAQQNPREEASGALKVEFTIAGSGEVMTSKVYELSNDSAKEIADCVEREAKRVKFPAFTADESVTKQAKFVF